jgi:hypothetical protein
MPLVAVREVNWLREFDSYYYDRFEQKPLPVLRVSYADNNHTSLYLDPKSGLIVMRQTTLSRANRWLYNGLHSLDFPVLYRSRPAWDLVVVTLSIGGIALTIVSLAPAARRLTRNVRRLASRPSMQN